MTNPTPAPNAGHAAETMSDEVLIAQAMADARAGRVSGNDRLYAKVIVRALAKAGRVIVPQAKWSSPISPPVVDWDDDHTAPARTAGTETGETT